MRTVECDIRPEGEGSGEEKGGRQDDEHRWRNPRHCLQPGLGARAADRRCEGHQTQEGQHAGAVDHPCRRLERGEHASDGTHAHDQETDRADPKVLDRRPGKCARSIHGFLPSSVLPFAIILHIVKIVNMLMVIGVPEQLIDILKGSGTIEISNLSSWHRSWSSCKKCFTRTQISCIIYYCYLWLDKRK